MVRKSDNQNHPTFVAHGVGNSALADLQHTPAHEGYRLTRTDLTMQSFQRRTTVLKASPE